MKAFSGLSNAGGFKGQHQVAAFIPKFIPLNQELGYPGDICFADAEHFDEIPQPPGHGLAPAVAHDPAALILLENCLRLVGSTPAPEYQRELEPHLERFVGRRIAQYTLAGDISPCLNQLKIEEFFRAYAWRAHAVAPAKVVNTDNFLGLSRFKRN